MLENIGWSFIGSKYTDRSSFESEFIEYQRELHDAKYDETFLGELVILEPEICIHYWCYDGEEQIEPIIKLKAENGLAFTVSDLMYQLHNSVVQQLNSLDHYFFEGLEKSHKQYNGPTIYKLRQGS